ncbi:FGGY-family carbohydrate kinase [Roseobacter sp.]|uniref:FGGY-family carbohydrate kinase n=1 Tax=Roseobacter sp. TaxID=1907202 RepID=UPI00385B4162
MSNDIFIGIDLGTSGARAIAINADREVIAEAKSSLADHGADHRDPAIWRAAADTALSRVTKSIERRKVKAIAIDGTSGTMLPIDAGGTPLAQARMYNDPCDDSEILDKIARMAPLKSAAHGATSGAAKALLFQANAPNAHKIVHQADWLAGQFCGTYVSDDNNALKTGYDSVAGKWPDWMEEVGIDRRLLPNVNEPGTLIAAIWPHVATQFDLPASTQIVSGTTDGCAAFLATGASQPGDGVTSIGTTLILKIISDKPIFDPASGIYSHRLLGNWLAGGASNTGGGVLLDHFSQGEIASLSQQIDPTTQLGLDYYPLSKAGERFPVSDPELQPKLSPRPDSDVDFLKAMFEGIAEVEKRAYEKLQALGTPPLNTIRTVGGAAKNESLTKIRENCLELQSSIPEHVQAAYGAALLAKHGGQK